MKRNVWLSFTSLLIVITLISGCTGDQSNDTAAESKKAGEQSNASLDIAEPVTLKIFAALDDDLYKKYVEEPVKKKYPNVTLERLQPGVGGPVGMRTLLSEGNAPDLFYSLPGWYGQQKLMDAYADLTPLIQKYGFDLNRLDTNVWETSKSYFPKGKIDFLPESMTTAVLVYNKSIFNRFGLAYPKDEMTWNQVRDLIPKLSRTEDGIQYRGFEMDRAFHINNSQLSLAFVNPSTNKANINSDGWQKYLTFMKGLFVIPGNLPDKQIGKVALFDQEKRAAMLLTRLEYIDKLITIEDKDLDWDVVTMPVFEDGPKAGTQVNAPYFAISPASEKKEAAFKVMVHLLSNEEQLRKNKLGRLTILKDETIRKEFGKDITQLKNKNIAAALKLESAKPRAFTIYDNYAVARISSALDKMVLEGTDVNTALREAEELTNQDIDKNKL